jgi:photosystem II stability/assembly factor-like uncharacterized protein
MLSISYSQNYWLQQPSPVTRELRKCLFVDSLYGWAIGDSGTVIRTTNGGNNWSVQNSGVYSFELRDLSFPDRNNGWIVCVDSMQKTLILRTTNSGQNWIGSYFPVPAMIFNAIYFLNSSTGFITGYSGRVFKSLDSGSHWEECGYDTTGCFYFIPKNDIYFINSQTGYTVGGVLDFQGVAMKTTTSGANWFAQCIAAEPLNQIIHRGGSNVYLMGGDYDLGSILAVTTNLGANWIYDTTGCFGNATGFSFRTQTEVWAALSFNRTMAVNLSAMVPGSTWQCIPSTNDIAVNDVHFINSTKGWAFGSGGAILKYNEAVISTGESQNNLPLSAVLYQNYPNPFNPVTVIKYDVKNRTNVSLLIYDLQGREVSRFNEGLKQPGSYSISFDPGTLASSVYYYRLITDDVTLTRKMVLLK